MITLYSTGCPKCNVLKGRLKEAGIAYNHVSDIDTMLSMGIDEVPVLDVDGKMMNFTEAYQWAKSRCKTK